MTMRRLRPLFLAGAMCAALAAEAPAQEAGNTLEIVSGPVLTIDGAIRLALERNKSLKVTSFERPLASAELLTARGQFDPALVFNRSTQEQYEDATTSPPPLIESIKTDVYSLFLGGQTPIGTTYSIERCP